MRGKSRARATAKPTRVGSVSGGSTDTLSPSRSWSLIQFDTRPPVARANKLPQIKDAVLAYGYPQGGSSLSITKGIVSRTWASPQILATARSIPMPMPECGTDP